MIEIVCYRAEWRSEFETIGTALRESLRDLALRVDHIGSTAVPGLAAKDIIDIQVTVESLAAAVGESLQRAGYRRVERIDRDHTPPGEPVREEQWRKWFFKSVSGGRPVNLHVRIAGRANQRYALLFRDYLRNHGAVAEAYAQLKAALARRHGGDIDAYCEIKDPVCDIVMGGAEAWAAEVGWEPCSSDQ